MLKSQVSLFFFYSFIFSIFSYIFQHFMISPSFLLQFHASFSFPPFLPRSLSVPPSHSPSPLSLSLFLSLFILVFCISLFLSLFLFLHFYPFFIHSFLHFPLTHFFLFPLSSSPSLSLLFFFHISNNSHT